MRTNTVGLSLKEAAAQAEAELALEEESGSASTDSDSADGVFEVEQPTVENITEPGLFDGLRDDSDGGEQPVKDSYPVTVDGETFEVTLEELRNGYMRQDNYTRGKQALADKEREAERAITFLKLLEERPLETVRKLYQEVNSTGKVAWVQPQAPSADVDIEALVNAKVAEALANDPRVKVAEQDAALAQIESIFAEIEEAYDVKLVNADKELILQTAVDRNTDDIKFVFGYLMNEQQRRKLAAANVRSAATTAITPSDPLDLPPVTPRKYESFRSAAREALAEQGAE